MSTPALEQAIAQTLAYADVFDYAMSADEIQRYLIGLSAPLEAVRATLHVASAPGGWIQREGPYYALSGRSALVGMRLGRNQAAKRLWPVARKFGRRIARLPFVRMVAVTGSLAVDNVEAGADLDYLIVTSPGRLWICRALLVLLARVPAILLGYKVCFNYLITETDRSLRFDSQNLYSAHEVAQMVPLAGRRAYEQLRQNNRWVLDYLPNAWGPPGKVEIARRSVSATIGFSSLWMAIELLLCLPVFNRLESWEMRRKIRRLGRRGPSTEASFSPDVCKGHFDSHQEKTLAAFAQRQASLERPWSRAVTWKGGGNVTSGVSRSPGD